MTSGARTRVLIVDDSAMVRKLLADALGANPTSKWSAAPPIRSWRAT